MNAPDTHSPRTAQDLEDEEFKLLEERLKDDSYVKELMDKAND